MNLVLALLLAANSVVISGPLTIAASTQKKILVVRIGATDVRHYDVAVGTKAHLTLRLLLSGSTRPSNL